jgi:hypothetical protein
MQREVDGVTVNCWYHRKFLEVARLIYVDEIKAGLRDKLNLSFLDVFNKTWKTKAKPFTINEAIAKRNNILDINNLKAVRYTSNQSTKFLSKDVERYNMRKINKVLSLASQINDPVLRSKIMLDDIFLNNDFITAAFKNYFDLSNYLCNENTFVLDFMICFGKKTYREDDYLVVASTIIQQIMLIIQQI